VLASALDAATARLLQEGKTPSRKVHELDNRGSHFYLAMYWADALSRQTDDTELQRRFASLAADLAAAENKIVDDLIQVQGQPVDIGGYYLPELSKCVKVMCPSQTFNKLMTAV
jgi:isocitrate dehydrogenase